MKIEEDNTKEGDFLSNGMWVNRGEKVQPKTDPTNDLRKVGHEHQNQT